jgi:hypothetical protein
VDEEGRAHEASDEGRGGELGEAVGHGEEVHGGLLDHVVDPNVARPWRAERHERVASQEHDGRRRTTSGSRRRRGRRRRGRGGGRSRPRPPRPTELGDRDRLIFEKRRGSEWENQIRIEERRGWRRRRRADDGEGRRRRRGLYGLEPPYAPTRLRCSGSGGNRRRRTRDGRRVGRDRRRGGSRGRGGRRCCADATFSSNKEHRTASSGWGRRRTLALLLLQRASR